MTYSTRLKHWSSLPRADLQEVLLPAPDVMDEAYESEAFLLDIGQCFRHLPEDAKDDATSVWSVAIQDENAEWQWQEIFQNINVASDTFEETMRSMPDERRKALFIKHQRKSRRPLRRKVFFVKVKKIPRKERHWLRRHGRHNVMTTGWDGSPPELQPLFQYEDFSKVYHSFITDLADKKTATVNAEVIKDVEQFIQAGRPTWERTSWQKAEEPDTFSVHFAENQTITGPESSDEDEETDDVGRAAKQALKKETPWRTISNEDRPKFIQANQDEWSEWLKWSSCKAEVQDLLPLEAQRWRSLV